MLDPVQRVADIAGGPVDKGVSFPAQSVGLRFPSEYEFPGIEHAEKTNRSPVDTSSVARSYVG